MKISNIEWKDLSIFWSSEYTYEVESGMDRKREQTTGPSNSKQAVSTI